MSKHICTRFSGEVGVDAGTMRCIDCGKEHKPLVARRRHTSVESKHGEADRYRTYYLAGYHDAMEAAAKVCESTALEIGDKLYWTASKRCAVAIRALIERQERRA